MKKVISIILIATVILSVLIFPAAASSDIISDMIRANGSRGKMYYDVMVEYHDNRYGEGKMVYTEYCHFTDKNSEVPDWVLMVCQIMQPPWEVRYGTVVGNRALFTLGGPGEAKSAKGLLVYVPKTDTIIDLTTNNMDKIVELCPDFIEVIEEKEIGQLLGDINEDNVVNILDVTSIQLGLAGNEGYDLSILIGDYDRDGETTIMDATAIQRMLAGLE